MVRGIRLSNVESLAMTKIIFLTEIKLKRKKIWGEKKSKKRVKLKKFESCGLKKREKGGK